MDPAQAVDAVMQTRGKAAVILAEALREVYGGSEAELRNKILKLLGKDPALFPMGWYDPPPGGIAVLSDVAPFDRLKYDTLRTEDNWPSQDSRMESESVIGIAYVSPVDRVTGMFGDIGLTVYSGKDQGIRDHIRECYACIVEIAEKAQVGMSFSELNAQASDIFNAAKKTIGWMTTYHDPQKINLGHTVPGTISDGFAVSSDFEDVKEQIRSKRVYINAIETYRIPDTCAFTVEARLTDPDLKMPNTFFHVIVAFVNGKRTVLTNFDEIFRAAKMDYML